MWLARPGGEQRACGVALACVAEVLPAPKQQLFGSRTPRLRLRLFTDAQGAAACGACGRRSASLCALALLTFALSGPACATALVHYAFRCARAHASLRNVRR